MTIPENIKLPTQVFRRGYATLWDTETIPSGGNPRRVTLFEHSVKTHPEATNLGHKEYKDCSFSITCVTWCIWSESHRDVNRVFYQGSWDWRFAKAALAPIPLSSYNCTFPPEEGGGGWGFVYQGDGSKLVGATARSLHEYRETKIVLPAGCFFCIDVQLPDDMFWAPLNIRVGLHGLYSKSISLN